jgi:hypothetical protein
MMKGNADIDSHMRKTMKAIHRMSVIPAIAPAISEGELDMEYILS